MNINKINSYISLEVLKTFTVILLTLSIIAWTARAVNFLDLIVENGLSFSTYLAYSILNLTNIITKFIPLSFLIALFLSILKFQRNNEFIILWTMGMSKVKLLNLLVVLIIFQFTLGVIILLNYVPNFYASLHQIGAVLIFITFVKILHSQGTFN